MTELINDPHGVEPDDATRALDENGSVESLLAHVSKMFGASEDDGWGEINGSAAALKKQRMEGERLMKQEANIFRDTFATPAGRKCLALLREMTIDASPYPSEAMLPIDAITPLLIAHDAQCKLVRAIFQAIAQAENVQAGKGAS